MLSGLAACSGIDIVQILEKMKVPFADLAIEVETEQTEDHPRIFKDIHIEYKIKPVKKINKNCKKLLISHSINIAE